MKPSVPIVLADGKTHYLRFGVNALCALEDVWNVSLDDLLRRLSDKRGVRFSDLRALLWAGLQHERPKPELEEVGDLMDLENAGEAAERIKAAIETAFPADEEKPKNAERPEEKPADPQS